MGTSGVTVARGGRRPASAGPAAVALSTALGVALSGFGGSLSCGGPAAPAAPSGAPAEPTSRSSTVTVGFWNVANLFHPSATGPGQPSGVRRLSDAAYQRKLAGLYLLGAKLNVTMDVRGRLERHTAA